MLLLNLLLTELVCPSDLIFISRVKRLEPTRLPCQWAFVDNMGHGLFAFKLFHLLIKISDLDFSISPIPCIDSCLYGKSVCLLQT